jgi:hypothetical protein
MVLASQAKVQTKVQIADSCELADGADTKVQMVLVPRCISQLDIREHTTPSKVLYEVLTSPLRWYSGRANAKANDEIFIEGSCTYVHVAFNFL